MIVVCTWSCSMLATGFKRKCDLTVAALGYVTQTRLVLFVVPYVIRVPSTLDVPLLVSLSL